MAGSRSERSAPGALIRWVLRCAVLTGLLVGGWLIGGSTALAGPLDLEIPLGTEGAPLAAPGLETTDPLAAVGTADGEGPAVLDTLSGSTGVLETVVTVAENTVLPEVAALPEIVDPVVGVTQPLLPPAGRDKALLEVGDPPRTRDEPEPVSNPVSDPAPLPSAVPEPVVSGPVAMTSVRPASAAELAAAARHDSGPEGSPLPDPGGSRSAPPCSTGSSSGSGAASGPAVIGEPLADPAPTALGHGATRTSTTRPRGLPPQPSTSPD